MSAPEYVWLAFEEGRIFNAYATRDAAEAAMDVRLRVIGGELADDWYQPSLHEYQNGTWWMRWYHDPMIVRGSQSRYQEIRRFEVTS